MSRQYAAEDWYSGLEPGTAVICRCGDGPHALLRTIEGDYWLLANGGGVEAASNASALGWLSAVERGKMHPDPDALWAEIVSLLLLTGDA